MYWDQNIESPVTSQARRVDLSMFEPGPVAPRLSPEQSEVLTTSMTNYLLEMFVAVDHLEGLLQAVERVGDLYSTATVQQGVRPNAADTFSHTDVDPYAFAALRALDNVDDRVLALKAATRLRDVRRISLNAPRTAVSPLDGVGPHARELVDSKA